MKSSLVISFWTAIGALFIYPILVYSPHFTATDIGSWGLDWTKFRQCRQLGFDKCVPLEISMFPMGYLLNSYFLYLLKGIDQKQVLLLINLVFLLLPIFFISLTRGYVYSFRACCIYFLAILTTALPAFYIYSGALEFQSGVIIGIFISSCILILKNRGHKKWIIFFLLSSAFLFPTYKETNIPLIFLDFFLCFISIYLFNRFNLKLFSRLNIEFNSSAKIIFLWGIAVIALSFAMGLIYNYIKFNSIQPIHYIYVASQTSPSLIKSLQFLMITYISPNGGIIVFWSASFFFSLFALRIFKLKVSKLGLLVSGLLIFLSSVGLSLWWTPFGWNSWGDRLIIPAMVSAIICMASTARMNLSSDKIVSPQQFNGFKLEFSKPRNLFSTYLWIALLVPILLSIHYTLISYYSNREKLMEKSLFPLNQCNQMLEDLRTTGSVIGQAFWRTQSYYKCADERFWFFPSYIKPDK